MSALGPNGEMEWYGDPSQTDPQEPFRGEPLERADTGTGPSPSDKYPVNRDALWPTHTEENYRTVFLQRLANPLEPYDPDRNPYITVDWSPIDLTVFNGEDKAPAWPPPGVDVNQHPYWDPDDPNPDANSNDPALAVKFETRQRGGNTNSTVPAQNTPPDVEVRPLNIWQQVTWNPQDTNGSGSAVFDHVLKHTVGYLNKAFQPDPANYFPPTPANAPGWTAADGLPEHLGDPKSPFPWLVWNNRPYVGAHELMLVPTSHPGRLLWEFGMRPATPMPYAPNDPAEVSYPYLMNLFESTDESLATPPASAQLHRVLDLVCVPSPFVGTEDQGNPAAFGNLTAPNHFHVPFHWISRFREPGKVNVNTVFDRVVWRGLMNYFPSGSPGTGTNWRWDAFVDSRRGYNAPVDPVPSPPVPPAPNVYRFFDVDSTCPTFFNHPVRSAAAGRLVPPLYPYPTPPAPGVDPLPTRLAPKREVGATLLRPVPPDGDEPLFGYANTAPHRNTDRNPFFHYQALSRLSNLVTTRSNVYAIWITVGYFEVTPWLDGNGNPKVDPQHPDGYQLGQELGIDTGEVERHRAFYMIDRSIPVGFQRGKDLNIEKTILLRRFIE